MKWSFRYPLFSKSMGKKRNVEGLTLDLTCMEESPCDIYALLAATELKEVKVPKGKITTDIRKLTHDELKDIVTSLSSSCNDCSAVIFYTPRGWASLKLCYSCHKKRFIEREKELFVYLTEKGHISCNFCGKLRTDPYDFHFDHINMFTKTGAVGPMLFNGQDLDKIKAEVDKCQLLCISCHAAVTHMERYYGFIKSKHKRNARTRKHKEEIYDEYMGEVYAFLRGLHGK
jgi:hypothetical protein